MKNLMYYVFVVIFCSLTLTIELGAQETERDF